MSFAWVLNLDAELELLRGKPGYVAQRKLLAQLAEHGQRSRALLGPRDVLLERGDVRPVAQADAGLRGRAWCPTPLALATFAAHGVEPEPHPEAAVLRRVNHRRFAHELGGGLPGQKYVLSRAELRESLGDYQRRWLLKRPLTFAGRGQLRVIGPLTDKQWTWIDASLEKDGLLLEPLVEPQLELSLHGFVWRDGRHELGRPCVQDVSERGAFRDVRLAQPGELEPHELAELEARAELVVRALMGAGYFGPFGIDAHRYRDAGVQAFCGLSEINARYTLAFTIGFPRHPSDLSLA